MDSYSVLLLLLYVHLGLHSVLGNSETEPGLETLPKPMGRRSNTLSPPRFTAEPKSHFAISSESVRLDCRVKGNPPPLVTWLKDGQPLADQSVSGYVDLHPDILLMFIQSKGSSANTGTYQCIASNTEGEIRSRNATVQLASLRNDFRKDPDDTWAPLGDSATLRCQGPKGIPEPEISWRKNNKPLKINSRIQVKVGGDLVISRLAKGDAGTYVCVATNMAGERESNEAVLRVQKPPRFTSRPTNQNVLKGQSVQLKCNAVGDPLPRISWSRNIGSMPERREVESNGNMVISNIQVEDEGEYICTAENKVGSQTASAYVTVQAEPELIEVASDTTVQVGETVSLPCRAGGDPPPTVYWRKLHGKEGMFSGRSYQDGHIIVADGTLTIYSVHTQDQGTYTCEALNPVGSNSAQVQLTVLPRRVTTPPPIIKRGPANATVTTGGSVLFECSSLSIPEPDISWYKDDKPVETGLDGVTQDSSGNLEIQDVKSSNVGLYTCQASNSHGTTRWEALLAISPNGKSSANPAKALQLPQAPSRPNMLNSTSDSITLSWKPGSNSGDSPIQYYMVEYYKIGESPSTWHYVTDRVRQPSCTVSHLAASSDYVFVVRSVNLHGVGDPSRMSLYMSTKDLVIQPTSTIPNTASTNLQSVSVKLEEARPSFSPGASSGDVQLSWSAGSNCDVIGGFMIVAQPVSIPSSEMIRRAVACDVRSFDLKNIVSSAKYEVRVRPYRGQEIGKASPIVFMSLQSGIVDAATPSLSIKVDPDDGRKVTFQWHPPRDLPAQYVTGYALRYRLRAGRAQGHVVHVNSSVIEYTLRDLRDDATYVANVTYSTNLGEGKTSEEKEFTIEAASTDAPGADEGFVGMIQRQPAVVVGVAVAFVAVIALIVGGICYYRKSKRGHKSRSLHASHRGGVARDRFDNTQYSAGFHMAPTAGGGGAQGANPGTDGFPPMGPPQSETNNYLQQAPPHHGTNNNAPKNTIVSYNANSDNLPLLLDDKSAGIPQGGFSYVTDQLTSKTSIPPQFSNTNLSRPSLTSTQSSTVQHLQQHQQHLSRQRSNNNSTFGSTNQADVCPTDENLSDFPLPPPPPSPPLSQRTGVSDRSRSSGMHSTGERTSRSSHKSKRSNRGQRLPHNTAPVAAYFTTDPDNDNLHLLCSPHRSDEGTGKVSPAPPTPPVRGASNYPPYGQAMMHFNHSRDPTLNLGYMAEASEGESEIENDQVAQLQVRARYPELDPRSSMAVSGVSMMNHDPSDGRDSSLDRDSTVSSSSAESFHMESVSQVGQHLIHDDDLQNNQSPRSHKPVLTEHSPHRQYSNTYHNYPVEDDALMRNSGQQAKRKSGKSRRFSNKKTSNNSLTRMNSASSTSSSYLHNTGDSGMSAGVTSTEHNSLNSNASATSAGKNTDGGLIPRSRTADNALCFANASNGPVEAIPPRLDIARALAGFKGDDSTPVSPTASGVSEQSGYMSTASSCWQFLPPSPSKQGQLTPRRPARIGTGGRPPLPSSQRPTNFQDVQKACQLNTKPQTPQHYPDQTPTDGSITQFQSARAAFADKLDRQRPKELSDVPEVSTSDFCEDYSDQSQ
ncbi:roundabout homolog 2-like isoform X2 [Clavelina lepadiformis]|uniref:roundabout homolog 2-like isoform X2 n=1 Tax=Clavelina lepadiformis TaxID=159417 RepID=UPI004043775D